MRNINKVYQRFTDELIWFCFALEQYNTSEEIDVPMIANTTVYAKTVSKTDQLLLLSRLEVYILFCWPLTWLSVSMIDQDEKKQ